MPPVAPEVDGLPTVIYQTTVCPECGGHKTIIYCVRPPVDGIIIRYHKCPCRALFKSVEQIKKM